ncbi:substrate-binding domain-containing protein [Salipiger sp. H15]|uniref:Substrate-binding domain-containing protein n=1 Tax=Alloyangia sp. H15 TaxID=3029062 RepID=A0AAU8API1_9RHOB
MKNYLAISGLSVAAGLLSAGLAQAEDLSYFEAQIAPYAGKPSFVAPGPSFDAKSCMADKKVFSIPQSSANPFTSNIEQAMAGVAEKVGFEFTTWENQGQVAQWAQGIETAINQGVDLIDLLGGVDPRVLKPQIEAAQKAGIKVVASHNNGMEQSAEIREITDSDVPIDYFKAGALLVDHAVVSTEGDLNALVLISSGPLSTDSMVSGIKAELEKCETCKAQFLDYIGTDWATRITPGVQSALMSNPDVNYIIVIYDSMSQFVLPAVTITGAQDRLNINAFNGTPFVLGMVQKGQVEMDIGENLDWIAHSVMDSEMRLLCGEDEIDDPKIPFMMFTEANAMDAGTPPELSKGYGDAYQAGFDELWQLK